MTRSLLSAILTAALAAAISPVMSVAGTASERDQKFFQSVEGRWTGPGEVVAGKYKGTKFTCSLAGKTPENHTGMVLDGTCRVGLFTQKMSATVEEVGHGRYRGTFLDGAKGKGLDIVAGDVNGRTVVFALNRNALKGTMAAKLPDPNTMMVTISVKMDDDLIPVIGVNLKRADSVAVDTVAQD